MLTLKLFSIQCRPNHRIIYVVLNQVFYSHSQLNYFSFEDLPIEPNSRGGGGGPLAPGPLGWLLR